MRCRAANGCVEAGVRLCGAFSFLLCRCLRPLQIKGGGCFVVTWGLCTSWWVDGPIVWFSVDLCFLCVPLAFVPVSCACCVFFGVCVGCFSWCAVRVSAVFFSLNCDRCGSSVLWQQQHSVWRCVCTEVRRVFLDLLGTQSWP